LGFSRSIGSADLALSAEELAEVILYRWKLPPRICIRDTVVTPTRSSF
jgi:NADP-dependent 3-hydroxy acid dehydrogenase YdfG